MLTAPPQSTPLGPGQRAPPFTLPVSEEQTVSLAQHRGAPVVLVFYPLDFSPICSLELSLFNEILPEFEKRGARLLAISVDSVWSHQAFTRDLNLRFPLLADFHPKARVARRYGVYRENDGFSERALFVIDAHGVIAWSHVSPIAFNPGADGVLEALDRITSYRSEEEVLR